MKLKSKLARNLLVTCATLGGMTGVYGAVTVESFESGDLNGWNGGTLNGSVTTVNDVRASDGANSAANTFVVSSNFGGWTFSNILSRDPRAIMDANATTLTVDVYSDWSNPEGWSNANTINLILNYQGNWSTVAPVSGGLVNGSFQTFEFDLTPFADTITNPNLSYSSLEIAWHVNAWAGVEAGVDNGTQTFAIDNLTITSIPEPSSVLLLGFCGMGALLRRRR